MISFQKISKIYPPRVFALKNITFDIEKGEFVSIVGPSGCGKSTFLRMLAGLETLTKGELKIHPGPEKCKPLNNVVFQEYAIFPWKNIIDNVAFGLQMRGISKKERYRIATDWLARVGLSKFANYYPHQISGGMKQRVSIVRALANDPDVLLMDEPLGALDAQTRTVIQEELIQLWEADRKTVVYITHSLDEAILMSDRVVLMTANPGTIKDIYQIDLPRPRTLATSSTVEYNEIKNHIWSSLRVEVDRVIGAQDE